MKLTGAVVAILLVSACSAASARSGAERSSSRVSTRAVATTSVRTSAPSPSQIPLVPSRLHCPRVYAGVAPWVPTKPHGISGASRLAPAQMPAAVLLCAYEGRNSDPTPSGWALSGRRRVTGNVTGMVDELTLLPREIPGRSFGCSQVGGLQFNYLIGLTYVNHATMWVSVTDDPNQCVTGTNGEFATDSPLAGADATKALKSGTWPAAPPISCTGPQGSRLTQRLVPPGSTSLTICGQRTHVITSNHQTLVSALNALKTHIRTTECVKAKPGFDYRLIFGYPVGPTEAINVDAGCRPPITNGNIQADSTGGVVSIIKQLTG